MTEHAHRELNMDLSIVAGGHSLEVVQHHAAGQQHGSGVGDVLVGDTLPRVPRGLRGVSRETDYKESTDCLQADGCHSLLNGNGSRLQ